MLVIKCFLAWNLIFVYANASTLSFVAFPNVIKELMQPLTVNCSFQISSEPQHHIDLSESLSILHEHAGVIASISKGQTSVTSADFGSMHAQGKITDNDFENSFLQLTWNSTRIEQAGRYFCTAVAKNLLNMESVYSANVSIQVEKMSSEDLLQYMSAMLIKANVQNEEQVRTLRQEISDLKRQLTSDEYKIMNLTATQAAMAPHIEQGHISCGSSTTFTDHRPDWSNAIEKHIPVHFATLYQKPPSVTAWIGFMDFSDNPVRFYFSANSITTQGFNITCGTWLNTLVFSIDIYWQSINQ